MLHSTCSFTNNTWCLGRSRSKYKNGCFSFKTYFLWIKLCLSFSIKEFRRRASTRMCDSSLAGQPLHGQGLALQTMHAFSPTYTHYTGHVSLASLSNTRGLLPPKFFQVEGQRPSTCLLQYFKLYSNTA